MGFVAYNSLIIDSIWSIIGKQSGIDKQKKTRYHFYKIFKHVSGRQIMSWHIRITNLSFYSIRDLSLHTDEQTDGHG